MADLLKLYEPYTTVIVATTPTMASQVPQCCFTSKAALVVDALNPAVLAAQGLRIDNTHLWVDLHGDVHVAPVLPCDRWRTKHCAIFRSTSISSTLVLQWRRKYIDCLYASLTPGVGAIQPAQRDREAETGRSNWISPSIRANQWDSSLIPAY